MSLLSIIIGLVVAGVVLWVINTFIPMAKPIKQILNIVVVVIVCIWLLQGFGFIDSLRNIRL